LAVAGNIEFYVVGVSVEGGEDDEARPLRPLAHRRLNRFLRIRAPGGKLPEFVGNQPTDPSRSFYDHSHEHSSSQDCIVEIGPAPLAVYSGEPDQPVIKVFPSGSAVRARPVFS